MHTILKGDATRRCVGAAVLALALATAGGARAEDIFVSNYGV